MLGANLGLLLYGEVSVMLAFRMYADHLGLLSTTEKGLQSCLNKLSEFCDANGLTVSLKKSNIFIFNKSGRKSKTNFFFNNVEVVEVQLYKYLGILFSSSGTFPYCQNDLYKRGLMANFKIGKCFGDLHQNVDTVLRLFDHTIKPVLLYGSEIWGTINTASAKIKKDPFSLLNTMYDTVCLVKKYTLDFVNIY